MPSNTFSDKINKHRLSKIAAFLSPVLLNADTIRRRLPEVIQYAIVRMVYDLLSHWYNKTDMTFCDCGWADLGNDTETETLILQPEDEIDRTGINLYHHVAGAVDLRDLDVLEVGCARGGGASYVMRYLQPRSMIAIDISPKAIEFCKHHYNIPGLIFSWGKAEKLAYDSESFDAVINIESSISYPSMDKFLRQVCRVLKPKGHFLYADMREKRKLDKLHSQIKESGLKIIREVDISDNVIKSIELDEERKNKALDKMAPAMIRPFLEEFIVAKKTNYIYGCLSSGERKYFSFVLQK